MQTTEKSTAIRKLPEQSERVETGAVRFGDDWPGVFIRGDNAYFFVGAIDTAIASNVDYITRMALQGLRDTLASSDLTGLSKVAPPAPEGAIPSTPTGEAPPDLPLELHQRLRATMLNLGIAGAVSEESFAAELESNLYALCRGVQQLLDNHPADVRPTPPDMDAISELTINSPEVIAAARTFCKRDADACGINADDSWNIYSDDFKGDALAALQSARHSAAELVARAGEGADTKRLDWLFANCRIVFYPPASSGSTYPIEHNPHARGYGNKRDSTAILVFADAAIDAAIAKEQA